MMKSNTISNLNNYSSSNFYSTIEQKILELLNKDRSEKDNIELELLIRVLESREPKSIPSINYPTLIPQYYPSRYVDPFWYTIS